MVSKKKWFVRFIAGNPKMCRTVITSANSPMIRSHAVENATVIDQNGWRGWVEDEEGRRIFETTAEQQFNGRSNDIVCQDGRCHGGDASQ